MTATGALWRTLHYIHKPCEAGLKLEFSPNSQFIILRSSHSKLIKSRQRPAVTYETTVWIWDIAKGALPLTLSYESSSEQTRNAFHLAVEDLRLGLTGLGQLQYESGILQLVLCFKSLKVSVPPRWHSPGSPLLVSGSVDSRVQLWDIATQGQDVERQFSTRIQLLEVSSNARFLASTTRGGQIQLWMLLQAFY